mmetsp:Transcript_27628/g.89995  ORF Transcript_27628/g.89995 Transcript_27628/m.89995 type:complete len:268 (-) Transcript_27628:94-897(-)
MSPGSKSPPALNSDDEGDGEESGSDLEDAEGVGAIKLGDLTDRAIAHGLLAENGAEREGDVGDHGRHKLEHVEVDLRGGRIGDSSHDGDEGGVHKRMLPLAIDQAAEDGGEGRLARLEHVSEAKSSSTKGNIASDVSGSMQAALLDDAGKQLVVDLGGVPNAEGPDESNVGDANTDAGKGLEPWQVQGIEGLLVGDIVEDVEEVPEAEVRSSLDRPCSLARDVERAKVDGNLGLGGLQEVGEVVDRSLALEGLLGLRWGSILQGKRC